MNMGPRQITYFNVGPYPIYFGCTQDPKAYARELKRLGIKDPHPFLLCDGRAGATTHSFENANGYRIIVCVGKNLKGRQLIGLLAHEATHVWQRTLEAMRCKEPADWEFSAYAIGWFTQCLYAEVVEK